MGARGLNKVQLIGNLTKDPEMKYQGEGRAICTFSIATNESYTDKKTGEVKEVVEYHNIVAFSRLGEVCGEYLKKGQQIYCEGSLRTNKYTDKSGVERYSTNVQIQEMMMLGRAGTGDKHSAPQQRTSNAPRRETGSVPAGRGSAGVPADDFDDIIPF